MPRADSKRKLFLFVLYHLRIVLAGIGITLFFNLLWSGHPSTEFWSTLMSQVIQIEIFLVIARRIFPQRPVTPDKTYKRNILVRLALFFLIIMIISSGFMLFTTDSTRLLKGDFLTIWNEWQSYIISWIIAVGLASTVFFYLEWTNSLNRERQLREEKLIFRYETLKNQINPHFLFNSLNTLSELIPKDPVLSDQFVTRLAAIYRYILEYVDQQWVSLSDELAFVKNHLFLLQIRDAGKVHMEININNPERYILLPISLQLLVENAVKHNTATVESPLHIQIYLEDPDVLVIENNRQQRMVIGSSKIGLENLTERVHLAMHRDLIVEKESHLFRVKLPIMKSSTPHEGIDN